MLPPAPMVIAAPAGMPRIDKEVFVVNGAVPFPMAGAAPEMDEPEIDADDEDDAADDDDDVELPVGSRRLCIAAEICELTRLRAAPFAMLDKPRERLASAEVITLIRAFCADVARSSSRCLDQ
jgi:hypothetical protein